MRNFLARPSLLLVSVMGLAISCSHAGVAPAELAAQARRQELLEARLRRLETRIRHMDHVLSLVEARPRAARLTHARAQPPPTAAAESAEGSGARR